MSDVSKELPKQERLLKLLKMTTSSNDGEALTAIRMANDLLGAVGWDWDKLIEGKIRVIEDPFKNLGTPPTGARSNSQPHPAGGAWPSSFNNGQAAGPPPKTAYAPKPPPPPPARGSVANPISSTPNRFPGFCWCCGVEKLPTEGFIFKPTPNHTKWEVICTPCNTTATIQTHAALHVRTPRKKSVQDLA